MERDGPLTPMRSPRHFNHFPHDSPFSDYFTDEARSVSHNTPPAEVKQLLVRLNNLGANVLRQQPSQSNFDMMCNKLDELEQNLASMEPSPAPRHHMKDSGFVEGDHFSQDLSPHVDANRFRDTTPLAMDMRTKIPLTEADAEDGEPADLDREQNIVYAKALLKSITKAHQGLRRRFEEMRDQNEQHASHVEEATREVLSLRSENDSLKATLAFDHSELLFLKLQLRALEAQADGEHAEETEQEREKRVTLEGGIGQWKGDWDDVDARQRGRRLKHRVTSSTPADFVRHREDGKNEDEEGEWKLDMCEKTKGRIQSITIRRMSNSLGVDGASDERDNHRMDERNMLVAATESSSKDSASQTESAGLDMTAESKGKTNHDRGMQTADQNESSSEGTFPEAQSVVTERTAPHSRSALFTLYDQDSYRPAALGMSETSIIFEQDTGITTHASTSARANTTSCASTTSQASTSSRVSNKNAEAAADEGDTGDDDRALLRKSAWAELMDSLTDLAGMTDR